MEEYSYKIYMNSYIDDYENGEVDGSYSSNLIEDGIARDKDVLVHKVAEFKSQYLPGTQVWIDDSMVHGDMMMVHCSDGYFHKPTDEEVEKWKKGEQRLWNVEYCMHISVVRPIEEDELEDVLNGEVEIAE